MYCYNVCVYFCDLNTAYCRDEGGREGGGEWEGKEGGGGRDGERQGEREGWREDGLVSGYRRKMKRRRKTKMMACLGYGENVRWGRGGATGDDVIRGGQLNEQHMEQKENNMR